MDVVRDVARFLRLGEIRSARLVDPVDRHWIVFIANGPEGRRAYAWADERWIRDDPEADVLMDALVAVLVDHGYTAAWVPAPYERLRVRATARKWPLKWYPADLDRLREQHASDSRHPKSRTNGAHRLGQGRHLDRASPR